MSGWRLKPVDEETVRRLAVAANVPAVVARLLVGRGVTTVPEVHGWLNPGINQLHPAELLPDFERTKERLFQAIKRREVILIWGHDDLDGVTATTVLYQALTGLQAKVRFYIPTKGRDKHGLDCRLWERGSFADVGLVVTVDCGITNHQEVALLKQRGVDVVVTDHHEVIDPLPGAVANVDPKRPDSGYPYPYLTGVGLALKLAIGLVQEKPGLSVAEFFSAQPDALVLTMLGTIADRAPITGENRVLVALGLELMKRSQLPAVQAVLKTLGVVPERLTIADFLGELLPLFAAASGEEGVKMFLSSDPVAAEVWVKELVNKSREWREEAERTYTLAQENVRIGDGILFVQHPGLSLRALGFSAARLRERYHMPAVVMGWRGDAWVGECRGMDGVDLMALLRALRRYFIDYGGHQKAAGFSIHEEQVADFIRAAERFAHENFAPRIFPANQFVADAALPFNEFEPMVARLGPFGEGNPAPVFISGPTRLFKAENGFRPADRPELVLETGRWNKEIESEALYRVIYNVDELCRLTVIDTEIV